MASFIATSNMEDILSDPSGNRRFLGVELTGPIDVSQLPNYEQLYAQALAALQAGEKTYFDAEQTKLIMASNRKFEVISPVDQYFNLYPSIASVLMTACDTWWCENREGWSQIVSDSVMDIPVFGVSVTRLKYLYMSKLIWISTINRDG